MEFSPTPLTKYLVTGEMTDQTLSQQGYEVLGKQALRQASCVCFLAPQILAGPTGEKG